MSLHWLNGKKWSHFEDRCFYENLLQDGESIAIIGPPRSGKTELVSDTMALIKSIKINCLMHARSSSLK